MKRSFLTIMFVVLMIASAFSTDYYVFFLGGQSNMDGYGYTKDLPARLNGAIENAMIFHGNPMEDNTEQADGRGLWTPLQPGHGVGFSSDGNKNNYSKRFGVELTLAETFLANNPGSKIAFVKYSRGGTSIDSLATGRFGCWEPDFEGKTGINQYDHFLATIKAAMSVQDIDGDGETDRLIPAGIFWMQGESDANFGEEVAMNYYDNLKRLMDLIRAALWQDDLPVVIGKISDSWNEEDGKVWDLGELIQHAQEKFAKNDKHAAIVRSTRYYKYSDPWHYDSEGYIDLGKEFAKAMMVLMEKM